jgi:hypothetical protein
MWWTLAGWLQHMPALPRLLLKTSNIHNFWSVGPKIMKFVLPQSLLQDSWTFTKSFKKSKIKWGQVTLPKTSLVTPGTFGLLGVKYPKWCCLSQESNLSSILCSKLSLTSMGDDGDMHCLKVVGVWYGSNKETWMKRWIFIDLEVPSEWIHDWFV